LRYTHRTLDGVALALLFAKLADRHMCLPTGACRTCRRVPACPVIGRL